MNVYFDSIGCRLNEAEVGTWSRDFLRLGHRVVHEPEEAELLVFNSCAVTSDASKRSRQVVRRLHRTNPSAKLVLTGCYSDLEPDQAKNLLGVDAVIPNLAKENLVGELGALLETPTMPALAQDIDGQHVFGERRTRAFVKIQDGCRNQCTFCVVTVARGEERSRSIEDVVCEVNHLVELGFNEVVITGVHIGGYGSDHGTDLRQLIRHLLDETTVPRIRMGSLEPWDLPEGFFDLWDNPRMCPHLHLPLQSGSDSVLKRMARRCSVEEYRRVLAAARSVRPDFNITTDLIVGFPGETDAEFEDTAEAIATMDFGHMHIFSYSRREGTPAARMSHHLPRVIKQERSRRIHELASEMKAVQQARMVGTVRTVLWENRTHIDERGLSSVRGYTDNYFRVQMVTDMPERFTNTITPVRLVAPLDANTLEGTLEG